MIYKFKPAAHISFDAQKAGEELERIRVWNNGRLEAVTVVEASRAPGAPLHPVFEWNDTTAADAYRVEQAKYLIRSIEVVVTNDGDEPKSTRAFVSVVRDTDRSYTSTAHALSDGDLRQQVLASALSELVAWRDRYAELVELAQVFASIDQARSAS